MLFKNFVQTVCCSELVAEVWIEPRAPHAWPRALTTKTIYFSSQGQSEDVKIPQANFFFFFFQFFHSVLQTQEVWLALHVEQEGNIGFAVEFFTSRCMKDESFLLLSPLTSAWRWVEMYVELFFLWRNWYRKRGEQGELSQSGYWPQPLVGKESKEDGENGQAGNSKWSTVPVCVVDYTLWWYSMGPTGKLCPVIKERHVCN